jgi:hypothetical protein
VPGTESTFLQLRCGGAHYENKIQQNQITLKQTLHIYGTYIQVKFYQEEKKHLHYNMQQQRDITLSQKKRQKDHSSTRFITSSAQLLPFFYLSPTPGRERKKQKQVSTTQPPLITRPGRRRITAITEPFNCSPCRSMQSRGISYNLL